MARGGSGGGGCHRPSSPVSGAIVPHRDESRRPPASVQAAGRSARGGSGRG
ncbi:hypothetical protein A33M_3223 [Rhodovulum sp. PH10]|nr:hypothetical protein A33M_3223 [Rhodovulum sp. PH10]